MTTNGITMHAPFGREDLIERLGEIARAAEFKGQYAVARQSLRDIAELKGFVAAGSQRSTPKRAPRRESTLLEAADAIAKTVKP